MGSPYYEYSRSKLTERFSELKSLHVPYGLVVRYAVKANPHPGIIQMAYEAGLHFDASSSYEAEMIVAAGIPGSHISLSSQQSPHNLEGLLSKGVLFVATSRKQLDLFLQTAGRPDTVGIRINPDMGSGHNKRTTTGGMSASFGIWHEYIAEIVERTNSARVAIDRLHIHIGSGADSKVWETVINRSLAIAERLPDVTSLDIGGGFKVHRFADEQEAQMPAIFETFSRRLIDFAERTGRTLTLEIEPGTYAVAHAGTLVATVDDIVDTGPEGYTFLRLNTGMNDFLRSSLYGARHEIEVVNGSAAKRAYVIVGHNCESGDILTPAAGNPEEIEPRLLNDAAIGDEVRIYDVGAYGASMRARGYNAFPDAEEVFIE